MPGIWSGFIARCLRHPKKKDANGARLILTIVAERLVNDVKWHHDFVDAGNLNPENLLAIKQWDHHSSRTGDIYIHTHVFTHRYTHTHTHIYIYIYIYIYMCVCVCVCVP